MDFPAVTVCNQNRVHCGHLKQMIAAKLSKTDNLSIAKAYLNLEKGNYSGEGREAFSLLEDAGCKRDFDIYDETVLAGGSFGCIVCVELYRFCKILVSLSVQSILVQIDPCIAQYATISNISYIPGKGKQSATTQRELMFLNRYMAISSDDQKQIGHQRENFIKSCTFGGLKCNVDNRY